MSSGAELRSQFFDIVHDGEDPDDNDHDDLPGWEMLFRVPDLEDRHTRITSVIIILVLCSLIVNLFRENRHLAKLTSCLFIQNVVYLTAGYLAVLVKP